MDKRCKKSISKDGKCCCNCKFQIVLHQHPNNGLHLIRGYSEPTGLYACVLPDDIADAVVMDFQHYFCELYEWDGILHDDSVMIIDL